jgi:ADP-heptose:LPS heptosyltransferase
MNTTFIISGGAGRVITAIPALEKYHRLNPDDDFKVIVYGWDSLYWSHPILQHRTFEANQKGLFELIIKNSVAKVPEPYYNYRFYNQKISLIEAFDEEINATLNNQDLSIPNLYLSSVEESWIQSFIKQQKEKYKKERVIVFQPFGSGMQIVGDHAIDPSNRSLTVDAYYEIVKNLSNDAIIFYVGQRDFRHTNDNISIAFDELNPYLRSMMALIKYCDYFIGIDSVGQHMARAFNKPGTVLMGGTSEVNYSYENHFNIIRKKNIQPCYSPWRLLETESNFSNRKNDGIMNFSYSETTEIIKNIQHHIDILK